jgi:N-acetylmuramoyl-L-alanine amidase
MPAGQDLGEEFHRAGGVPAVMHELLKAGKLHADALNVSGQTIGQCYDATASRNQDVIRAYATPLLPQAGFAVLKAPTIPSILVETAFISNPDEENLLRDPAWQARLVDALAEGIRRYFVRNPPLARHRRV